MEIRKMSTRQALLGVSEGIAALRLHRARARTAEVVLESKILQCFLHFLRKLVSPIFSVQKYELFECDDIRDLPPLAKHTDIHTQTYDGAITVPQNVVDIARPNHGEALSVVSIANTVVGYVRAAFKDTYAPDSEVLVNVRAGEVYLHDLTVMDGYKGVGLSKYLVVSAARAFHERGFSKVIIGRSMQHGVPASLNIERLGFSNSLVISAYRFFGIRINVLTRKH